MSIKNKDGSVYKLRSPNPIMKVQDIWSGFELHNMDFQEEKETTEQKNQKPASKKLNLGQVTKSEEKPPEKITVNTIAEPEPKKIEIPDFDDNSKPPPPPSSPFVNGKDDGVIRPTQINEKLKNYKKTILHCLPATVKQLYDDLYNDRSYKVSYGKRFTFEVILIEESDMILVFWTHLQNLEKFSILYPQNFEKRWWKIDAIKQAPEGYFIRCLPSEDHPAFTP